MKDKHERVKVQTTMTQDFVTGLVSSLADVFLTHPLWTIKTLQQQGLSRQQIWKQFSQKPLVAYTGIASNAATMIPLTTTRILLSSFFHKQLDQKELAESPLPLLGASFGAGCISSLFGAPTELIRTIQLKQATLANHEKKSFMNILREFLKVNKLSALGNGSFAIMMRDGSYTAAFFTGAPLLKEILSPYISHETLNTVISYSVASISASLMNHPFDTIKTRQHLAVAMRELKHTQDKSDFMTVCKDILLKNGVSGFWRGYAPRGIRFLLGLAVKASCIEALNDHWTKQNNCTRQSEYKRLC